MNSESTSPEGIELGTADALPAPQAASDDQALGSEPVVGSAEEGGPAPVGPGTKLRRRRVGRARGARKRIVIHAGVHRTGVASIQHMLSAGRANLEAQGIAYPEDFVAGGHNDRRERNHDSLARAVLRGELTGELMLEWLAAVVPPSCNVVVLSARDFCRLQRVDFLTRLQTKYDVQAAIYLRRQDHWLTSWYNYNVMQRLDERLSLMTPMEFLEQMRHFHWLNYFSLLERWARLIGRDNVHARALGVGQLADSAKDFADLIGARLNGESARMNESISADKLELGRRLQLCRLSPAQRNRILKAIKAIPSQRSTEVYSASVRRLVMDRYAAQNRLVARYYFGRQDGRLFLDDQFGAGDVPQDGSQPMDEQLALRLIEALLGTPA